MRGQELRFPPAPCCWPWATQEPHSSALWLQLSSRTSVHTSRHSPPPSAFLHWRRAPSHLGRSPSGEPETLTLALCLARFAFFSFLPSFTCNRTVWEEIHKDVDLILVMERMLGSMSAMTALLTREKHTFFLPFPKSHFGRYRSFLQQK